ncbi:MAG TPA: efflux RND transporter periplasmic adaptor subunit [Candidatus Hydrogenedentes bacterium]|nr:efflux RND transporter periplasmic adaptor subunit [Candidatus Hydrogenedentota bacterium]
MKRIGIGLVLVVVVGLVVTAMRGQSLVVEMSEVSRETVFEFVVEDAKTRLDDEYMIDMPISGTVERINLEIGEMVMKGDVIATVDPYALKQEILQVKALIRQNDAFEVGVDIAKPKEEDIESAKLRVKEMNDSVSIARKSQDVLKINRDEARKTFERSKGLLAAGATSESLYDEAELRYKGLEEDLARAVLEEGAAKKALEQAGIALKRLTGSIDDNEYMRTSYQAETEGLKASLALLQDDMKKTTITAPVSGPVLEKFIEDQRVLLAGEPLLKIGDMDSIEIESDVLSEEIAPMRVGNKVEIKGKALQDRVIFGKVKRIYPSGFMKISSLGVEQQRVRTIIEFDNSEVELRPGTSVDIRIITADSENTLAIPDRALFRHQEAWALFVVNGDIAELKTVEVGLRNDDWAEIVSGVEEGTLIVSELKNALVDGLKVSRLE